MAEQKRYYWLRLHDDFFNSKRIKKLRGLAGGDTFVIIYLKMQLLAMKTDGIIRWTGLEDDFAAELALDLDESPSDVEVTLLYLLKTGLAETEDNVSFFFPYAVTNTGSETASAQRVRDFRARQALQSNVDVTTEKRICNVEKEIKTEIESKIEKEEGTISDEIVCRTKDVRRVVDAWNGLGLQQITKITPDSTRGKMLKARIREHGLDAIFQAIDNVGKSSFLKGQNSKGWTVTFEWFVKPNNFVKVLEGNYDDHDEPDTDNIFLRI